MQAAVLLWLRNSDEEYRRLSNMSMLILAVIFIGQILVCCYKKKLEYRTPPGKYFNEIKEV
jgi:hypothetical protein